MFCARCGKQIADNAQFCNYCGTPAEVINQGNGYIPQAPYRERRPAAARPEPASKKGKKNTGVIILVVLIAVFMLAATLALVLWQRAKGDKTEVDLNQYLVVTFEGNNTEGTADIKFDYNTLTEDLSGDDATDAKRNIVDLLTQCIYGTLDKQTELSNGDIITFVWDNDDEEAAKLGYTFVCRDKQFTVSGLYEPTTEVPVAEDTSTAVPVDEQPAAVEEAVYVPNLPEGWYITYDANDTQIHEFTNSQLMSNPIKYCNGKLVVGKGFVCWNGSPHSDFDYPVNTFSVYEFNNRDVLSRGRHYSFLNSNEDAQRYADMKNATRSSDEGTLYVIGNVVYQDDPRVFVNRSSKKSVVKFHTDQGCVPVYVD